MVKLTPERNFGKLAQSFCAPWPPVLLAVELAGPASLTAACPAGGRLPQEMVAQGIDPKLRSFTPALIAYAEQGSSDKAFEGGSRPAPSRMLQQRRAESVATHWPLAA